MWRAYRAEWLRLRRSRSLRVAAATGALVTCAFTVLLVLLAARRAQHGVTSSVTRSQLVRPDGLAALIHPAGTLILPLIALVLVGGAIAAEYRGGMIRVLLTQNPGRIAMLAGKLAALATCLAVVVAAAVAAALAVGVPLAEARGVAAGAWFRPAGISATAAAAGDALLASAGWGLAGAALAILTRSVAVTIGVAAGYLLIVENILAGAWQGARHWFPGHVIGAIGSGGAAGLPYGRALGLAALYMLVIIGAAGIAFARRDVTE
jgi:ABC-type transport system involved in multi-copper enzyme maturation permease subunit